ncbi:MAG: CAP domain-containing protein [Defluviitaleaceae bacterium]|nr:CAP domain-containing protein [Defluviitaleaceae bacterium]
MKLRYLISAFILSAIFTLPHFTIFALAARSVGDIIGDVHNTDIRVFINGAEIRGYNIGGFTYVIAEDLRYYGFNVVWDGTERTLNISQSQGSPSRPAATVPINQAAPGSIAFQYMYSDIRTFIAGTAINSYNVEGVTVIRISDVANAFNNINLIWDGQARQVHVTIAQRSNLILPNRTMSEQELHSWMNEYWAMGGATAFEHDVIRLINGLRRTHGWPELIFSDNFTLAARFYTQTLADLGLPLGHNEGPYGGIINTARLFSQNAVILYTSAINVLSAQDLFNYWASGYFAQSLLNPGLSHIGVGSAVTRGGVVLHYLIVGNDFAANSINANIQTTMPIPIPPANHHNFARQVHDLVNAERTRHGLPSLEWEDALASAALAHSRDMAANGFVSHNSSDGRPFYSRIAAAGFPGAAMTENVAAGHPSPEAVVRDWMLSPLHRDNILQPSLSHGGVGFVFDENSTYGFYWTHKFIAR